MTDHRLLIMRFPVNDFVTIQYNLIAVFENKEKIILVMEYADGGEMYDYISSRGRLTESESRTLFRQIVSALHHLHEVIISTTPAAQQLNIDHIIGRDIACADWHS